MIIEFEGLNSGGGKLPGTNLKGASRDRALRGSAGGGAEGSLYRSRRCIQGVIQGTVKKTFRKIKADDNSK